MSNLAEFFFNVGSSIIIYYFLVLFIFSIVISYITLIQYSDTSETVGRSIDVCFITCSYRDLR